MQGPEKSPMTARDRSLWEFDNGFSKARREREFARKHLGIEAKYARQRGFEVLLLPYIDDLVLTRARE